MLLFLSLYTFGAVLGAFLGIILIRVCMMFYRFIRFTISLRHIPKHPDPLAILHLFTDKGFSYIALNTRRKDGTMEPVMDFGLYTNFTRCIGITDPDDIQSVLQADYSLFPEFEASNAMLRECNGKGISEMTNIDMTRIFSSFIHLDIYQTMAKRLYDNAQGIKDRILEQEDESISGMDMSTEYVVKSMNSIFFDDKLDWETICEAEKTLIEVSKYYIASRIYFGTIWNRMPFGSNADRVVHREKIRQVLWRRLEEIKSHPEAKFSPYDIMHLLYVEQQHHKDRTDKQIIKSCMSILFSGMGSTIAGLGWTLYYMALYPKYRAEIQKEVSASIDHHLMKHISRWRYTLSFVKESLRLNTPHPASNRIAAKDCELGGQFIPAGTPVCLVFWCAHRHEKYWVDPDKFIPDRFLNNAQRHSFAMLPFSTGSKSCLGQKHALNMMIVFAAVMASTFQIELDTTHKVVDEYRGNIFPIGLHCKFSKLLKQ